MEFSVLENRYKNLKYRADILKNLIKGKYKWILEITFNLPSVCRIRGSVGVPFGAEKNSIWIIMTSGGA